jgi:polyisoprenoid-binding protein YceI
MDMNRLKSSSIAALFLAIFILLSACTAAPIPQTGSAPAASGITSQAPTQGMVTATSSAPSTATNAASPAAPSNGELRFDIVPAESQAHYKVREQLANVALPNDAVGTTKDISGSIILKSDGSIDSAQSKITVGLASLQTDRSMRDNFVKRNVLATDQYPNAIFVPTSTSGLTSPMPKSGKASFQLTGNLTIRDVTKPVTWDVVGTVDNGKATGTATTTFKFEDFNLQQPRVPMVLSIEDHITLEVDVTLQMAQ